MGAKHSPHSSEVGGVSPTGKSFRFVSCVRARGGCRVRSGQKEEVPEPLSLFPFLPGAGLSLFPRAYSWIDRDGEIEIDPKDRKMRSKLERDR